jgi:hypothetical protein
MSVDLPSRASHLFSAAYEYSVGNHLYVNQFSTDAKMQGKRQDANSPICHSANEVRMSL